MLLGVGWGQNVGLRDFCHILTLLPLGASVFHKQMSSLLTNIHTKIWESEFSFMESEFVVATFPWKVENEKNPRTLAMTKAPKTYHPAHLKTLQKILMHHPCLILTWTCT